MNLISAVGGSAGSFVFDSSAHFSASAVAVENLLPFCKKQIQRFQRAHSFWDGPQIWQGTQRLGKLYCRNGNILHFHHQPNENLPQIRGTRQEAGTSSKFKGLS